ncbi:hypothetical protein TSUD_177690 [Trifolium subterraneum]|uniref:DUF247 domain protein n=1 Tax=Trifolium subterraneum TaxID=3900 RepID=A0A2Z6PSP2_TRISU|nr:hypothetical protein TSUD_177690 [Trifolium subterraneum]
MPRVVSIGPRFVGRKDLLPMEAVKLKCMSSLLSRASVYLYKSLMECGEAVRLLVKENVRVTYAPDIVELGELSDIDLTKIMLVDGCFLLELLISKGLDSDFPSDFPNAPTAELINNEDILSDLMLFENQIPTFILLKLSKILFPQVFGPNPEGKWSRGVDVSELVLNLLGYSPLPIIFALTAHILDLVCFSVDRRTGEGTSMPNQEEDHVVVDINNATQTRPQQLKLKRCALRLLTAGVTIKVTLPEDKDSTGFGALSCFSLVWNSFCSILFWLSNIFVVKGKHMDHIPEATGLDFYFKFQNRKLEIEQLHITKTTKAKWCNLIAWEHHQKIKSKMNHETGFPSSCNSTCAALIFNGLICSADDVQFLKDKKIVVDHLKMSNQQLMELFREIALGVDHRVVDSSSYYYVQMVNEINNISKAFLIKRIWSTVWNSFTYRQEWLLRFMNHNYNFVATVISLCTVVQTIYTIIAYQLPK